MKSVLGRTAVLEISSRLGNFRELLEMTILVELRDTIDFNCIATLKGFDKLEESTRNVVVAIMENRSVFSTALDVQTAELKEVYAQEAARADTRHQNTKATIFETARDTTKFQAREHEATRQEIAQKAANDAAALRANMDKRADEIKALIRETKQAKGRKERTRLKEKANAAATSCVAMELMYDSLMEPPGEISPRYTKKSCKFSPYETRENDTAVFGLRHDDQSFPRGKHHSGGGWHGYTGVDSSRAHEDYEADDDRITKAVRRALAEAAEEKRFQDEKEAEVAQRKMIESIKAGEERAIWEKRLKEEKETAMGKGVENAKKAIETEREKVEEKAAEEKAKAEAAAELAQVKKEAAEEAAKLKEEAAKAKKKVEDEKKAVLRAYEEAQKAAALEKEMAAKRAIEDKAA